jgi:hypothetical protein
MFAVVVTVESSQKQDTNEKLADSVPPKITDITRDDVA